MTVENRSRNGAQPPGAQNASEIDAPKDSVVEDYERLWAGVYEKARRVLDSGERDLSRVHLFMRRNFGPEFEDPGLQQKYRRHEKKKSESGFIYDKQLLRFHDVDTEVASLMTDAVKMREVITSFGPSVERIVELGSGWGKNLFNLFKFGAPLAVEYHALELTETGRKITRMLADEVAPTMRMFTHEFDYYRPDFGMFAKPMRTGVLTHHSIEQIPKLPAELIEAVLAIPGFSCCVHLEPCGFQVPADNWLEGPDAKSLMQKIDERNRAFCETKNQNRNLYPLLLDFERRGRLKIHVVRKYFTSHLLSNATTLIVWGPADQDHGTVRPRRDDRPGSGGRPPPRGTGGPAGWLRSLLRP